MFFDDIKVGKHCRTTDWYEASQSPGNYGQFWHGVNPALLGFDDDVRGFCHAHGGSCDMAGFNMLSMFGHIICTP